MSSREQLPEFLRSNFIEFNPFTPDSKLTALRKGLSAYYETYQIWLDGFYDYFYVTPREVFLSEAKGHGFLERYFTSIAFVHLSFEQFILELLERLSPMLAKAKFDKTFDLVSALTGDMENRDYTKGRYVEYSIALNRIENLIKHHDKIPTRFQVPSEFHFLADHITTLRELALLRNDIIHSGKHHLNKYTYEWFFVNRLLPLIRLYLDTQTRTTYLERNLHCGKNVINELSKETLPEIFNDLNNVKELKRQLRKINHLKELGRASYKNPLDMMENTVNDLARKQGAEAHNSRVRDKHYVDIHVAVRQEILGHYEVHTCPCCGTNSLTTFDMWVLTSNGKTRVETAECVLCSYKVNVNIGEPKEFGLMATELFKYVD